MGNLVIEPAIADGAELEFMIQEKMGEIAHYNVNDDYVLDTMQKLAMDMIFKEQLDTSDKLAVMKQLTGTAMARKRLIAEESAAGNNANLVQMLYENFGGKGNPFATGEKTINTAPVIPDNVTDKFKFTQENMKVGEDVVSFEEVMAVELKYDN